MKAPMKKKLSLLVLLFVTSLTLLALFPAPVKSDFTVIRVPADYPSIQSAINAAASGSIILVSDGIYYERLVVKKTLTLIGEDRETTIVDGNGTGTVMTIKADNVVVNGFTMQNGGFSGIYLEQSEDSMISGNMMILNGNFGVCLNSSCNNTIVDNIILNNGGWVPSLLWGGGIESTYSNGSLISGNTIANHANWGLILVNSVDNLVYHNNFLNNSEQADQHESYNNVWNNGTEGNYWDDYVGLDSGNGGRTAGDGVGDTGLPHFGFDNFPLIIPSGPIHVICESTAYPVTLLSNSTISEFRFMQTSKKITFTLRGPSDTFGYCNVTIPKNLLSDNPWKIMLGGTDITYQAIMTENQTHTSIYFTYTHSNYNVQIIGTWVIPEFPSPIILSLFIITTLLIIIVYRYRKSCFHDSHLKNVRESPRSSRT